MSGLIPFNRRNRSGLPLGPDHFHNMLDDFFSDSFMPLRSLSGDTFKIDVEETDQAYKITAELPGVSKEEISVDFYDGRMTIGIEKDEHAEDANKNYVHRERRHTSMSRSMYLADGTPEDITARLEEGLLHISVPKQARSGGGSKIHIE